MKRIAIIAFIVIISILGFLTFSIKDARINGDKNGMDNQNLYVIGLNGKFGKEDYFGHQYMIGNAKTALEMYEYITRGWEIKKGEYGEEITSGSFNRRVRTNPKWNMMAEYSDATENMKNFTDGANSIITARISISPLEEEFGLIKSQKGDFNNRQVIFFYVSQEAYDAEIKKDKQKS